MHSPRSGVVARGQIAPHLRGLEVPCHRRDQLYAERPGYTHTRVASRYRRGLPRTIEGRMRDVCGGIFPARTSYRHPRGHSVTYIKNSQSREKNS